MENLPSGKVLYDLFCGGCAVTHAAMLSGKWERVVANDLQADMPRFFLDACNGKYKDEKRWISRDDFYRLKDTDAYVRQCWSFGNNGRDYLYSRNIEPWRKALHFARVLGDCSLLREMGIEGDGSRRDCTRHSEEYRTKYVAWYNTHRGGDCNVENRMYELDSMARLQSLESLERLESLESLERLEVHGGDWRDVPIEDGGIVYCDPPYRNASGYVTGKFDHAAFDDWARNADFPVYVSEYSMPDDFVRIWAKSVDVLANHLGADGKVTEGLWVHEKWIDGIPKTTLF